MVPKEELRKISNMAKKNIGYFLPRRLYGTKNVILRYHSVGGCGYGNIKTGDFESHIQWLSNEYEIVDLPSVVEEPSSSNKKVAITFDDGYKSFYDNAVPILQKYSAPATVFVIGASVKDPHRETDRRYMEYDDLIELTDDELVTIGNHTMNHPKLTEISDEQKLNMEINMNKKYLESELDITISRFCYPYNAWDEKIRRVVKEEHNYAVAGGEYYIGGCVNNQSMPRISGETDLNHLKYNVADFPSKMKSPFGTCYENTSSFGQS